MSVPKIQCTACGATLKPSQPIPEGKRVKCPKCQETFTVTGQGQAPPPLRVAAAAPPVATPVGSNESPDRPRRRKRRRAEDKKNVFKTVAIALLVVAALAGGVSFIVFVIRQAGPRVIPDNLLVTMENYDKLKPGGPLSDAVEYLGEGTKTPFTVVVEAYRDRDNAIKGMMETYTIHEWLRWKNKNASIYAGIRKGDDGTEQLAVLGFLDIDPTAKDPFFNFGAAWKVMPMSVELSNVGVRTSIGKPLPEVGPSSIDKVQNGMGTQDVLNICGPPASVQKPSGPSGLVEKMPTIWRYYDSQSNCLPPPAFAAGTAAIGAPPGPACPLLPLFALETRIAAYDVDFIDGKVTEKRYLRVP